MPLQSVHPRRTGAGREIGFSQEPNVMRAPDAKSFPRKRERGFQTFDSAVLHANFKVRREAIGARHRPDRDDGLRLTLSSHRPAASPWNLAGCASVI